MVSCTAESEAYAITAAPELKDVTVNRHKFAKDSGFPTTGFTGAAFTLNLTTGSASDYAWAADAHWVSVTDGVVTFTSKGTGDKVTITGTPTSGQGKIIKYSFTLKSWFINGTTIMSWSDANAYCSSQGYSQPTVQQINGNNRHDTADGTRGILGGLWSEWGSLSQYDGSGFIYTGAYWLSESSSPQSDWHYFANLEKGWVDTRPDGVNYDVVCRQGL